MKDKKELLAITIISIFLGIILSIQFKTVKENVGEGQLPTQRAQKLALEIKTLQKDKEAQEKHIEELEEKIKKYEKGEIDKSVYAETLYKDTEKYRMLAGYTDIEGPGIIIEINDPDEDFGYMIVDELELILQIVSVLNAADAEAISINGQRYTSFTEIERASDHIMINGVPTNSPIIIKAIGDPKTLESAVSIKGGMVQYLRDVGYKTNVSQEELIQIERYKKIQEFIFSTPVEEEME